MSPHDLRRTFIVALLCACPLQLHAQTPGGSLPKASPHQVYSADEVRKYAQALVMISRIREAEKAQAASMTDEQRRDLTSQAHEQVGTILQRFNFDRATFNRISARVDTDPGLRRRVQQLVMEMQIGT